MGGTPSPLASPTSSPESSPSTRTSNLPNAQGRAFDLSQTHHTAPCPSLLEGIRPLDESASPLTLLSSSDAATDPAQGKSGEKKSKSKKKSLDEQGRAKKTSHVRRARARAKAKAACNLDQFPSNYEPKAHMEKKFVGGAAPVRTDYDASSYPSCSTGYVSLGGPSLKRAVFLEDLIGEKAKEKFLLVKWEGRYVDLRYCFDFGCYFLPERSTPFVDSRGRIYAVLVAPPKDLSWDAVHRHVANLFESTRGNFKVAKGQKVHRRGKFTAFVHGISQGQGQPRPMTVKQDVHNEHLFNQLFSDTNLVRIAGAQSSQSRQWALYMNCTHGVG